MNIDNPSKNQSVLNPLYHHASDSIDKFQGPYTDSNQVGTNLSNLHIIDINKMKSLPCFGAPMGNCREGAACNYSHEKSVLQAAYDKKLLELSSSPYAKSHKSPSFSNSRQNSDWKSQSLGDSRHTVSFPTSPFTPASKTPARPLRKIYEESHSIPPPEDDSDRVHRSGSRFRSATPLPDPPTQVSILNRNVV
jgi:hypothetical protein